MARRGWRVRVPAGQREFFPKGKPSDQHKEAASKAIPEARAQLEAGRERYERNWPMPGKES